MKKLLIVFFVALLNIISVRGQVFYETSWKYAGITYEAFLIYYDDNDATMRVEYLSQGKKTVAEYPCYGKHFEEAGESGYLLDGRDAKIVIGYSQYGYNADNFIFYLEQGEYHSPVTIDDYQLKQSNVKQNEQPVLYWKTLKKEELTASLLRKYFNTYESKYKSLLKLGEEGNLAHLSGASSVSSYGYGNGQWHIIESKGTDYTGQKINSTSSIIPKSWIIENWDNSYSITNVGYGGGKWAITMSKNSGYGLQSYNRTELYPSNWVKEKWDEGYAVTSAAYGNGEWMVVMTKNTGYGLQSIRKDTIFPKDWIMNKWDNGYQITSVTFGNGVWAVTMTQGSDLGYQTYMPTYSFPSTWIKTQREKGYLVTDLAYGKGMWHVVTTKETGLFNQQLKIRTYFPATGSGSTGGTTASTTTPTTTTTTTTTTDPSYSKYAKLHLIVVANTMIPDIGSSCQIDKNNILSEFDVISHELNMPIQKTIIDGIKFTRESLTSALSNLNPGSNDVVIFVYSGHGFRWTDQESKYPVLDLRYSNFKRVSNDNAYYLSAVYNSIVNKGARLNLIIGDCCNSSIGVTSRGGDFSLNSRRQTQGKIEKLKSLFYKAKGNMLVAAAKPNQTACGNGRDGGYFLSSFFAALSKETSYLQEGAPSWNSIVQRAISNASYKTSNLNGCSQQDGIYYSNIQ